MEVNKSTKLYSQSELDAAISKAVETNRKKLVAAHQKEIEDLKAQPFQQVVEETPEDQYEQAFRDLDKKLWEADIKLQLQGAGLPLTLAPLLVEKNQEDLNLFILELKSNLDK